MTTALETTGLGKRYGRTWALRDCTLALPAGRVAALVGPNGAGKSTLLHLAVGLTRPDAGGIRVLGERPADNTGLLERIGFVAQDTPLYHDFTAAELATMGRKLNRRRSGGASPEHQRHLSVSAAPSTRPSSGYATVVPLQMRSAPPVQAQVARYRARTGDAGSTAQDSAPGRYASPDGGAV